MDGASLAGRFLIAVPTLADPYFERTVVYLCAHNEEGALGVVINQPLETSMREMSQHLEVDWQREGVDRVYMGGPVSPEQGFVLFEESLELPGIIEVQPDLFMGTNPDIIRLMGRDGAHERFLFALGYAGWDEGQLEVELQENSWLVCEAQRNILFELDYGHRWEAAIRSMGIDPSLLVDSSHGFAN
ncbi:YqgE/AlgH family protein [Magnetococcus sp. PR-3]|uniref:YqgE/AlgH family protein n=1 Tax=Magnetococcus sp. PR-3 TaxID=3120355 RepID=UPI002FCE50D5